jgi:hypothetical protein
MLYKECHSKYDSPRTPMLLSPWEPGDKAHFFPSHKFSNQESIDENNKILGSLSWNFDTH